MFVLQMNCIGHTKVAQLKNLRAIEITVFQNVFNYFENHSVQLIL